jgi:glycerate dehydrogenase
MKIVVLDGHTLNPGDLSWEGLQSLGECTVYDRTPQELLIERAKDAEIILTNKVLLLKEGQLQLNKLKYIGVLATGYNVVDVEAASVLGIIVTNIPAYSTDSVAQMVFAHILNFSQRVELHSNSVRNGDWVKSIDFYYALTPQTELAGKTIGIVGFGKIGQKVAQIALAFGMNVLFQNRSDKSGLIREAKQVALETLFRESDFISINCQLAQETKGFVNAGLLRLAKPSVFIINTGRGLLLNESDVADALNSGLIGGLGADVLSTEPPVKDNPLLNAKNCFITPHIAWATKEARERLMQIAVDNVKSYINGNPVNVVNP